MTNLGTAISPEDISHGLNGWLQAEINESDAGRNAYLSEFEDRRADFYKIFDDQQNFQAQKAKSHYTRLVQWAGQYGEDDFRYDDRFTGRLIFACMMDVSGSYRKQCFLQATDEADYFRRRHDEGPTGIDVLGEVTSELLAAEKDGTGVSVMEPDQRLRHIITRTLADNDKSLVLHRSLHPDEALPPQTGGSLASAEDPRVLAMLQAQKLWVGLAVAHIIVAASFRGNDYEKVPLLEAKSITDVQRVVYPFAA